MEGMFYIYVYIVGFLSLSFFFSFFLSCHLSAVISSAAFSKGRLNPIFSFDAVLWISLGFGSTPAGIWVPTLGLR